MAEAAQRSTMLELIGLKVSYGGIQAVKGVDLTVQAGELVALIGANGAGQTTTLKAITAGLAQAVGQRRLAGTVLSLLGAHPRAPRAVDAAGGTGDTPLRP